MPTKKTTTKKTRQTGKKEEFAYTITDKYFPDFKVLNTANAWWLDGGKVRDLIAAFKIDATIQEACVYAGITIDQYKYFTGLHPDFSIVKTQCKQLPFLKARKKINDDMDLSYSNAMDYMSRKKRDEFSQRQEISEGTPKQFNEDDKKRAKEAIRRFRGGNS